MMSALPIIEALKSQMLDCSPAVREREPGLIRLKTGLAYPTDGVPLDSMPN